MNLLSGELKFALMWSDSNTPIVLGAGNVAVSKKTRSASIY